MELGAPTYALDLWFALNTTRCLCPVSCWCLPTAQAGVRSRATSDYEGAGIDLDTLQLSHVVASFAELELQPGALEAFQILTEASWQLIALTNGSEDSTRKLLQRSNAIAHFASIFSCDAIGKTKPHPDVYAMPKRDTKSDV